jgi:hypothetical protein
LQEFYLGKCLSLITISEGLGNLTSLIKIDLREYSSLTTLPKGLGNLTSLPELNIQGCSSLYNITQGTW